MNPHVLFTVLVLIVQATMDVRLSRLSPLCQEQVLQFVPSRVNSKARLKLKAGEVKKVGNWQAINRSKQSQTGEAGRRSQETFKGNGAIDDIHWAADEET